MSVMVEVQQNAQIARSQINPDTGKRDLLREWSFPVGYTTTVTVTCEHGVTHTPPTHAVGYDAIAGALAAHAAVTHCDCAALYARERAIEIARLNDALR